MFTTQLRKGAATDLTEAEVEIYLDDENLRFLIIRLQALRKKSKDHMHFMTESWGEGSLSETLVGEDVVLINHLKIAKMD